MRFALTQKVLTFLMAASAAVPLVTSGEVSIAVSAIFGALVVAGWFLEPPLTGDPRFRKVVTGLMIGLLLLQGIRAVLGAPIAMVAMEYALFLLGLKLCSRFRYFDYQQIAILSFLHVIGATVTTYDVSYAVSFVAFVVLVPSMLALAHLRNEMERRFRHDEDEEGQIALSRLLASKRVVSGRFVLSTGFLALPVLLVTVTLFIAFPRFGLGFFGRLPDGDTIGGFSAEVKLGDIDRTRLEDRVILRLEPVNRPGKLPDRLRLKLRGAVFDSYDDDTWRKAGKRPFEKMSHRGNSYPLTDEFVPESASGYDILLESLEPPYLFVPDGSGMLITESVAKDGALKPRKLESNDLGVIRYDDPSKVGIRYRTLITGAPVPGPDADNPSYLALPPGSRRLAAMARETATGGTMLDDARAIVARLKREYRYSTDIPEGPDGITPIDDFLFRRRTGTCEHFATAATLMFRAVGIRSRLVTGFSSAVWNPIGEYYAVQARFAHAWTEAYIDGRWQTFDATPPAPPGQGSSTPSTMAMIVDAIRMRWHKHVIGYDASTQMDMGLKLARLWRGKGRGDGARNLPWRWFGAGALALLLAVVAWRNRRKIFSLLGRRSSRPSASRSAVSATALLGHLERHLGRMGLHRKSNLTPIEYLHRVRKIIPSAAAVSSLVITRYNEVRFGGGSFAPGEMDSLREQIRSIQSNVDTTI